MPALTLQEIRARLTPWMPSSRREEFDGLPGIYIIAEFRDSLPNEVDPLDERVVCIGETHAQTIPVRLGQFFTKSGSTGYRGIEELGLQPDNLYISVVSPLTEPWLTETLLKNLYIDQHGRRPICNVR